MQQMSHKERKIERSAIYAQIPSHWRKVYLPVGLYPPPPLPLFFSRNLKGPRGNWIDNGHFNWILFLFFSTDGKGSYRIAFVWAGFIQPLESPTKNALNVNLPQYICDIITVLKLLSFQIFIQICETKLINYVANWDPLLLRTFNFVKNQLMNKMFQCAKLINCRCIWLSNYFFSNQKIFTLFFPDRSRIVLSSQNNSIEIKEKTSF